MKRPTALHPFLFVLLPVLTSYSERVDQTLFAEVWTAAAIALAFAALLVLATLLLVRSLDRAALWVTSAVLVFSYYGAASHWMGHWRLGAFELCMNWFLLPPCLAFLGWAGYRLARTSRQFGRVTKILNLVAAFALRASAVQIGTAYLRCQNLALLLCIARPLRRPGGSNRSDECDYGPADARHCEPRHSRVR